MFLFLSYSFEIETIDTFIHSVVPNTIPDQSGQSVYPFSDQNGAKPLPDGAAHIYMAYIGKYPPPRGGLEITLRIMCSVNIRSPRH